MNASVRDWLRVRYEIGAAVVVAFIVLCIVDEKIQQAIAALIVTAGVIYIAITHTATALLLAGIVIAAIAAGFLLLLAVGTVAMGWSEVLQE